MIYRQRSSRFFGDDGTYISTAHVKHIGLGDCEPKVLGKPWGEQSCKRHEFEGMKGDELIGIDTQTIVAVYVTFCEKLIAMLVAS